MKKTIFVRLIWMALLTAVLVASIVSLCLYRLFDERVVQELNSELNALTAILPEDGAGVEKIASKDESLRVTLIEKDGTVVFDSRQSAAAMDNHGTRQEVAAALKTGYGYSRRRSDTLSEEQVYAAERLDSGRVLRLARNGQTALGLFYETLPYLGGAVLLAVFAAYILAERETRRIVDPINRIDPAYPERARTYDELSPMLSRLALQKKELEEKMDALRRQRDELSAISENMREGLVMLDDRGCVLSINQSAREIFTIQNWAVVGVDALGLCRQEAWRKLICAGGRYNETEMVLEGRVYRVSLSPVPKGEGSVILIENRTEKARAERMRRDFTANVSHELKTPLTSIGGYAEILENGLARPEDIPAFAGRIRAEAARMLRLIQDILRLSMLDEGNPGGKDETVDLREAIGEVLKNLSSRAQEKQVTLEGNLGEARIQGDRTLAQELAGNLIDNAILYNRPGGFVRVTLQNREGEICLTVEDNGIGIPAADREKVFERFYRVDKSRSKASGGTGLGLAIVRHAALILNARVSLQSEEGAGTRVSVCFPEATSDKESVPGKS